MCTIKGIACTDDNADTIKGIACTDDNADTIKGIDTTSLSTMPILPRVYCDTLTQPIPELRSGAMRIKASAINPTGEQFLVN